MLFTDELKLKITSLTQIFPNLLKSTIFSNQGKILNLMYSMMTMAMMIFLVHAKLQLVH
jgi:hypothetical protein